MNPEIRLITDEKILATAYSWADDSPSWFRETLDIWKETLAEYIKASKNEFNYGVFIDDEVVAVVRLVEYQPFVFNLHLYVKRGADFEVLLQAGRSLRDYLKDKGAKGFFGWLPSMNRSVARLYKELGFTETGLKIYKGQIRGKTVEWRHYAKSYC